ncbi:VIT family protein [Candidatus Daviesbacteria bacterium]|nr:VIT family protein [Candidatus Daviesbacteria bacterium]
MSPAQTEPHSSSSVAKLNWLRAAVLGANDGIVSIAGLVVGVASVTTSQSIILTAGIAGIIAGAISMAAGEYISVSSSRDTEKALLKKERHELREFPKEELEELAIIYERKGLSRKTALTVAQELTKHDAFAAHAEAELHIDPHNLTNPWHAAFASAAAFLVGAVIPLVLILIPPAEIRIPIAFVSVIIALAITGVLSALVSGAGVLRAIFRVTTGGAIAMAVTYGIGRMFNVSGI